MAETVTAPAAPETTEASASAPAAADLSKGTGAKERMFKVVVDGKEQVLPESKIIERAQKGMAAEKDMAEAAQMRQAFTRFVADSRDPQKMVDLLSNPKALGYSQENQVALMKAMLASKDPGMVAALKQWLYENEVEPSTLTPEQRKLRELEQFKIKAEASEAQRLKESEDQKYEAEKARILSDYKTKIWQGIQTNKLPQTELMVARVARKVQLMRKNGMPADVAKACEFVRQDLTAEYREHLGKAEEDNILDLLPDGLAERINKAFLNRLKAKDAEKIKGGAPVAKARGKEDKDNLAAQLKALSRGKKVF